MSGEVIAWARGSQWERTRAVQEAERRPCTVSEVREHVKGNGKDLTYHMVKHLIFTFSVMERH